MTDYFQWKDNYELGIKEIDAQHQYFVSLINKLYNEILLGSAHKTLDETFVELINYAEEHFQTEERYFKEFSYIESEAHIDEHHHLKNSLTAMQTNFINQKNDMSFDLIDFLEDWLINHIETVDRRYVACFQENGVK